MTKRRRKGNLAYNLNGNLQCCYGANTNDKQQWLSKWIPVPGGFGTTGFSAVTIDGNTVYVAARKADDGTIWLDQTNDVSLPKWAGWSQIPGGGSHGISPASAITRLVGSVGR